MSQSTVPPRWAQESDLEYAPNESADWVIWLTPSAPMDRTAAQELSTRLHQADHSHTSFGRQTADGLWTFAGARGVEGPFDALAVAVSYLQIGGAAVSAEAFGAVLDAVRSLHLGEVTVRSSPAQAAQRSTALAALAADLRLRVEVQLQPASSFEPQALHDALLAQGLQPTDGPMYEPDGRDDLYGTDAYADLLRVYLSVPRTHDPVAVFDEMMRVAQALAAALPNAQLVFLDGESQPMLRERVAAAASRLRDAGIEPGSDTACQLF